MKQPVLRKKLIFKGIKNVFSRLSRWQKTALAVITVMCIATCSIFFLRDNGTLINIQHFAPGVTTFTDDVSAAFLSSDNIPDVNNNRDLSSTRSMIISFQPANGQYIDVFKPNINSADLARFIKISPFIKGTFHKYSDEITFTPDNDWPADTKFTFKMSPELFSRDIKLSTRTVSFRTSPITAKLDSFNIYPDATQPKSMVGVAVVSFDYPINPKNFDEKVLLKLNGKKLKFSVKFDKFYRTALITSSPIAITNTEQTMRLKLNRIPARDGDTSTKKLTAHANIESADNFFRIIGINTTVADNLDGNTQQLILLNTTAPVKSGTQWRKYLKVYLLPTRAPNADNEDNAHEWQLDEITPEILRQSSTVTTKPVDFVSPHGVYQYAFSYEVSDTTPRYIYIDIQPGLKSGSEFELGHKTEKVLAVQYPNPTVKIAGSGALLSLAGDRKLGIMARGGVSQAYVNLYKIKSSEINHLVSQTYDLFSNNIDFKSYSFGKYDMSSVFQKQIPFANTSMTRTNYASIDLGEYLDRTGADKTGIFIIQTSATPEDIEYSDQRLIMLTDMGIIRKRNLDNTTALFVANLSSGTPAADTEISVLGRNGNPIWAGRTDETGHTDIPNFAPSEYKNAREPIAIVARNQNDVTFIPFNPDNALYTEYSKFDIDGEYATNLAPLNAYVFSDRGIYRPGESATIAGIIKNKAFKSMAGIPVRLDILDAHGREVLTHAISLESDGMFDLTYNIPNDAPVGTYTVRVNSLNSKNKVQDMIGITTFQVAEFTPDTMKITANINDASETGWISPDNITAKVTLKNLFGTPAPDKRISATATLTPISFKFPEYKHYTFTPNFISGTGMSNNAASRSHTFTTNLPDIQTDESGHATFDVKFDTQIPSGTYMFSLNIRGFEGNSGKSVQTIVTHHVSDAKYLVGVNPNADLSYIPRDANVSVNLVAIDSAAQKTSANNLTARLIKRENLTSLIKDSNNYYKYQTVTRDKVVFKRDINIPATGTDIKLDTANSGTYYMQILDSDEKILSNIEYFVAASDNSTLQTETQAELKIKLDKTSYKPGDTINISITTPYIGAGLITIERDKVYTYKWFQAKSTSSVQQITVPEHFTGTGYINVAFVRDINSHDIFTSPYAYAVAPFSADISAHKIDVKLSAPQKTTSNQLTIEYETSQDARIMIFAVNTGILQVAKYKIPNPLAHFFKKSALQVDTYQTLSLLLPEYNILREFAKTGGGDFDEISNDIRQNITNPFARKLSKSVAFHSGIITTQANTPQKITFDIPEEFNGNITTFAIATDIGAMGWAKTDTLIQAPIIVSTTMPTFIAPSDTINISATVSNLTNDSGDNANIAMFATASPNLTFTNTPHATFALPPDSEHTITFDMTANGKLGNADLEINANLFNGTGKQIATRRSVSTMSIRPITTFKTVLNTDELKSSEKTVQNFLTNMYPEFGTRQIYISQNAYPALRPMFEYLSHYDFNCSEQTVSRAIPYVLMSKNAFIGTTYDESAHIINNAINVLKNRQNDDGSFALWASNPGAFNPNQTNNAQTAYLTSYVVHFLTMAKNRGFAVPKDMLARGIDYLRTYSGNPINTIDDAYSVAYAIYVITANGFITTSYINTFEEYARTHIKNWDETIMGAYIATAYKLLKQSDKADALINKYRISKSDKFAYRSMFDNNVANDAMYSYLLATYFKSSPSATSSAIRAYINSGNYSAFTSAAIIMGLVGVKSDNTTLVKQITVTADGEKLSGKIVSDTYIADIPANTQKLTIECKNCNRDNRMQYTIQQQGFPLRPTPVTNGIEIIREYYDASGNRITSGRVGDIVTVKIFARARGTSGILPNVAITDLMPGGFIPDAESLSGDAEYYEVREDRILIYTTLTNHTQEFTYSAQIGTRGTFTIPPVHAESMYNPQINATSASGTFTVSNVTNNQ